MGTKVFVYGSLRRGEPNHRFLGRAPFVRTARTAPRFTLLDRGAFPALVDGGTTAVVGEVYDVGPATLERLDWLEGHPRHYVRKPIAMEDGSAVNAYLLTESYRRGLPVVESGDWCKDRRRTDADRDA